MPKLPIENFDPTNPPRSIQEIALEGMAANAQNKRRQERRTALLTYIGIGIGAVTMILAYLTLVATEKANSANQAATDATNKLLQLEETVRHQQDQYRSYQTKNDSISTTIARMKEVLKKYGIDE